MARKSFLYYLFNKDKKPLYVNDSNQIVEGDGDYKKANGQPAHLKFDPQGWKDTLVKYARNLKYWGLFRDMTVPMKFARDGAKILRQNMWTYGIEATLYLGIAKLDRLGLPYNYRSWYISEINFVKYEASRGVVQVEALEGGPVKYLKAYESTTYEIPVDEISVLMDGMELDNSAEFYVSDGFDPNPAYAIGNHLFDMEVISKEIEDIGGVQTVPRTKVPNNTVLMRQTGNRFFKATSNGTVHIEYDFILTVTYIGPPAINPAASLFSLIRRIDENNVSNLQHFMLSRTASQGIPGQYHLQGSVDMVVRPGDELYGFTYVTPEGASGDINTSFVYSPSGDNSFIKLTYTYRHPESVVDAITPFTLGDRIIRKMSNGLYGLKSDFLKALGKEFVLTCGNSLRGLKDTVCKTSMADFFKSFNRWGIGLGVEGDYIVIERLSYFFPNTISFDLGEVDGCKLDVAEDLLFNTIKNGYKAQEYKEINGKMEFNQGQVWTTPITKYTKELDLQSVYRADPFGIELLRINFGGKKTTDTNDDNDTFFLYVKKKFPAFNATVAFDHNFGLMLVFNEVARLNDFKPGTKFRVTGTAFNDGLYTVAASSANVPGGPHLVIGINKPLVDEPPIQAVVDPILYNLNRPPYTNVSGLLHPGSTFNIELSPKRSLLENAPMIHSVMDLLDAEEIKIQSSDKNKDLSTTLNGVTITENESIKIAAMAAKLFKPYYFEFQTKVPINLMELLATNPYGKVSFSVLGQVFYGFLFDGGLKPATQEVQTWKLLCAPENDLKTFYNE
jgi:hypothetical protein